MSGVSGADAASLPQGRQRAEPRADGAVTVLSRPHQSTENSPARRHSQHRPLYDTHHFTPSLALSLLSAPHFHSETAGSLRYARRPSCTRPLLPHCPLATAHTHSPTMTVQLDTSHGAITIKLYCKETPRTCRNFIELAKHGYYDGVIFHVRFDPQLQTASNHGAQIGRQSES